MTPCEKLGYKVGDRFEVVEDCGSKAAVGSIIVLYADDGSKCPRFYKVGCEGGCTYCPSIYCIRPLKTEAEKRGAKFGTTGVVKAKGFRISFVKEREGKWRVFDENGMDYDFTPSEIRLDHEPEYKEIPFSEATDEQRMDVGNLVVKECGFEVSEIKKFSNGQYAYTVKGSTVVLSATDCLTVRVPA